MSKEKIAGNIWSVMFEGVKIYFSNIDKFILFMLFPVFGQLIGLALTFGLTIGLAPKIAEKTDSLSGAMVMIILLAIPGLLIFLKAFWDYMVCYVALNSMTEGAIMTGKVYDFQSHREVATRRAFKYIGFLLAVGILSFVAITCMIIPVLGLIPPLIIWIFFILVFQVFTFEQELGIKECFKRSYELVSGYWFKTFILMFILAFFSIFIITEGMSVIFDCLHLTDPVTSLFDFAGKALPLEYFNKALRYLKQPEITVNMISKCIYMSILGTIVAQLSLPIRSICFTLWYKALADKQEKTTAQKPKKKAKKEKDSE